MSKFVLTLLAILGILITLFGIGVDYLLPGTSPGFDLPQLLIVVGGASAHAGGQEHYYRSGHYPLNLARLGNRLDLMGNAKICK